MSKISDFASNSIMGVVRKIVNHIVDNVDPQISDATDHLPARFSGTFNDSTRNLTMTIESQGPSAENLVATVNIPAGGGGSGGPTYSAGNGITITPENAIEIDTAVTATKQSVDTLQGQVGDAFSQVAIGADGKSLDFTALDGQVNNVIVPNSRWKLIDYDNFPTDFNTDDIIRMEFSFQNNIMKGPDTVDYQNATSIFRIGNVEHLHNVFIYSIYPSDTAQCGIKFITLNIYPYSQWNNKREILALMMSSVTLSTNKGTALSGGSYSPNILQSLGVKLYRWIQ